MRGGPPAGFRLATVELAPGGTRPYEPAEWADALVVVVPGSVELECRDGGRRRFARGEALWLSGLPLRALRNPGSSPALLVAISREGRRGVGVPRAGPRSAAGRGRGAHVAADPRAPRLTVAPHRSTD